MSKKSENVTEKLLTPVGELTGFISVFKPSTKFDKAGKYSANIILSKEDGEKVAEKIKEIRTEQFKKYGKGTKVAELTQCTPLEIVDEETGEAVKDAAGRYVLKTSAKAYIEDGKPQVFVKVMDSKLQVIKSASVGQGTKARLGVVLSGYSVAGKTGVSVKLKMVQILELVEYGNSLTAEAFGFTAEDGFEASEENFKEIEIKSEPVDTEEPDEEEDF